MRVRRALLLSDVHLGWAVCSRAHARLLDRLPEAVDDAELVVLNGDLIDAHRGVPAPLEAELIARFATMVAAWRAEGRTVVYIEGNHDSAMAGMRSAGERSSPDEPTAATIPIAPDRWMYDWEGAHGERVRVLHGHRFADAVFSPGIYEGWGRHVIWLENQLYGRLAAMRAIYRFGPGWLVAAVGLTEDVLWSRDFPARADPLLPGADVLVHGHFHFGPGHWQIAGKPVWKTGAWVSRGHLGSADRMLRYRDGRFERIGLTERGFRPFDDGR